MSLEKDIKIVLKRLKFCKSKFVDMYGKYNAKRLSSYPRIDSILHKGICFRCKQERDLIHFDDNVHLCGDCASESNLI